MIQSVRPENRSYLDDGSRSTDKVASVWSLIYSGWTLDLEGWQQVPCRTP